MFVWLLADIGPVSLNVMLDPCAGGVVYIENNVTIECQITDAFPEVTSVSWFREHDSTPTEITPGSFSNIAINTNQRKLNISPITSTDNAVYFCRVSNGALTEESDRRMLTVNSKSQHIGELASTI